MKLSRPNPTKPHENVRCARAGPNLPQRSADGSSMAPGAAVATFSQDVGLLAGGYLDLVCDFGWNAAELELELLEQSSGLAFGDALLDALLNALRHTLGV